MTQTIVITGSTSGIGKATAVQLLEQGQQEVISSESQTDLDNCKQELAQYAGVHFILCDVSQPNSGRII